MIKRSVWMEWMCLNLDKNRFSRCSPSCIFFLGEPAEKSSCVLLAVSKLLVGSNCRNTLAGNSSLSFILFVCVKFPLCPHPSSHPFPSSVHPSIHTLCQYWLHPGSHNHIPAIPKRHRGAIRLPSVSPRSADGGPDACRLLLHRQAKNTNTEPDFYRTTFHLSIERE